MRNRGWCLFRGCRSQAFFFGFIPRCFCYRARRFFWFWRRRNVGRDLLGFIAPTFFFFADLRVERVPAIAPEASAVASQMRKRTTATERNRARDTINSEGLNHAAPAAGSGTAGAAERIFSRSRRRMAFNLPPSNNSRQVRYIQVSSTTMEASARYVGL